MSRAESTQELFNDLLKITQENIDSVQKLTKKLSEKQLNWRPNVGVWSIAEILAHLNSYSTYYHPTLMSKIESTRFNTPQETFVSSPLGKSAWKSMKLGKSKNVRRKFNAPKNYNPSIQTELIKGNEIETFLNDQENLKKIIEKAKNVNLRKIKIPISISRIVRLRLGDVLKFVIYHNERHVEQLRALRSNVNFPKK